MKLCLSRSLRISDLKFRLLGGISDYVPDLETEKFWLLKIIECTIKLDIIVVPKGFLEPLQSCCLRLLGETTEAFGKHTQGCDVLTHCP